MKNDLKKLVEERFVLNNLIEEIVSKTNKVLVKKKEKNNDEFNPYDYPITQIHTRHGYEDYFVIKVKNGVAICESVNDGDIYEKEIYELLSDEIASIAYHISEK